MRLGIYVGCESPLILKNLESSSNDIIKAHYGC